MLVDLTISEINFLINALGFYATKSGDVKPGESGFGFLATYVDDGSLIEHCMVYVEHLCKVKFETDEKKKGGD